MLPGYTRLGTVNAINDLGHFVGDYGQGPEDQYGSPYFHDGEALVTLQDALPPQTEWRLWSAVDINESGQIAAVAAINWTPEHRAVLLTPIDPNASPGDPTTDPTSQAVPTATCPFAAAVILATSLTGLLLTKRRGVGRAD